MANRHTDIQMGCYREFVTRITGEIPEVWLIAAENKDEFDVVPYRVPEAVLDYGWEKAEKLLGQIKYAFETGVWPGLCDSYDELYFPSWAMPEEEEIQWS